MDPGSCSPVSMSTTPEPDAIAHALQWGTPGHGSGSRNRHSPGSTRSPRPSSRRALMGGPYSRRVDSGGRMTATDTVERYLQAMGAQDLDAAASMWEPG